MKIKSIQDFSIAIAIIPAALILLSTDNFFAAAKTIAAAGLILIAALLVPTRYVLKSLGEKYGEYGFSLGGANEVPKMSALKKWLSILVVGAFSFGGGLVVWGAAIVAIGSFL